MIIRLESGRELPCKVGFTYEPLEDGSILIQSKTKKQSTKIVHDQVIHNFLVDMESIDTGNPITSQSKETVNMPLDRLKVGDELTDEDGDRVAVMYVGKYAFLYVFLDSEEVGGMCGFEYAKKHDWKIVKLASSLTSAKLPGGSNAE
jgi:hypothetical protein